MRGLLGRGQGLRDKEAVWLVHRDRVTMQEVISEATPQPKAESTLARPSGRRDMRSNWILDVFKTEPRFCYMRHEQRGSQG